VARVLIVAGSPILRAGLENLIGSSSLFTVVGSLGEPERLPEHITGYMGEQQPDLVVVEWTSSRERSLLSALGPDSEINIPIVVLADDLDVEWVAERLRAGARAVLPRDADPSQILAAMESVAAGLSVLHPVVLARMLSAIRAGPRALAPLQPLTPRELEVLNMLAEGLGNKSIAWKLGISEHTVKFHIASLFDKLDASSRAEAVAIGIRHGLIML